MKRVNSKRRRSRHMRNFCGGIQHHRWIQGKPCAVCADGQQQTRTEAAHWRARGMGGVNGSWKDQIPLCQLHHTHLDERMGRKLFQAYYRINLPRLAKELVSEHLAELGIEESDERLVAV